MPPRVSRRLLAFQLRLDVLGHHTDLFHGRLQLIRRAAKFPRPVLHLVVFVYIDAIRVLAAAQLESNAATGHSSLRLRSRGEAGGGVHGSAESRAYWQSGTVYAFWRSQSRKASR